MIKKIFLLLVVVSSYTFSQGLDTIINGIAQPLVDGKKNLSISIGLFEAGADLPKTFFYGRTSKDDSLKPNENTTFEIGSVTMTFTATILMMLAREGKMQINDLVQNYLPDSVTIHNFTSTEHIKLMHLVTHTSGLPRLPSNLFADKKSDPRNPYAHYTLGDMYVFINNHILDYEPGTKYIFSNFGMGLLGHLMMRKTGKTYEELLHYYILDSLGMNGTGIKLTPEMNKNLAKGYTEKGEPAQLWDFGVLEGAGAVLSNMKDMLKYLAFHMGKTDAMDFKESAKIMQKRRFETDMANVYIGMAWQISETSDGRQVIWNSGGTGGYMSFIAFMPETGTGVVVLTNQASSIDEVGIKVLKALSE